MAVRDSAWHGASACLCLAAALAIQIGTNFANDYFDFIKGTDTADRKGPTRVMQAGLVQTRPMLLAIVATMSLAAVIGGMLYCRAGLPVAVITVVSIACGILYTAGPFPLAYIGLGDVFAFIFFGPVAVAGTYYVQALTLPLEVVVAGLAPGCLSTAMITVNNLRDIEEDKAGGKCTLAVMFGAGFARLEFCAAIVGVALAPVVLAALDRRNWGGLAASVVVVFAVPQVRSVLSGTNGPALNDVLAATGKLMVIYAAVFSIGWLTV